MNQILIYKYSLSVLKKKLMLSFKLIIAPVLNNNQTGNYTYVEDVIKMILFKHKYRKVHDF